MDMDLHGGHFVITTHLEELQVSSLETKMISEIQQVGAKRVVTFDGIGLLCRYLHDFCENLSTVAKSKYSIP